MTTVSGPTGQVYTGQVFGSGYVGQPGDVYIGCTFIATVNLAEGTILENCQFQCKPTWYGCSGERSKVAAGSVMNGGMASYVDFRTPGVWSGVNNAGNTTPPDCVDCAPKLERGVSTPIPADAVVASGAGHITYAQWCAQQCKPGIDGVVVINSGPAAVTVAIAGKVVTK